MNMQRSKEISESPEMINVTYDGMPIYIHHVDEETGTAGIFPLGDPQSQRYVPLNGLEEQV